jgi:hypothetical protein
VFGLEVDTTPPAISIIYPANTYYKIGVSALNYTVSGATNCWYSLNNGVTNTTIPVCGNNITGLTSTEGSNTWRIYANDSVGNLGSASVTFTIDTIAPAISIISPIATIYNNRMQLVNITALDTNLNTTWFFNGTANVTYTTPVLVTFAEGSNTLYAYANDSAGNLNSTSVTFTTDTINPAINFTNPTETSGTTLTTRNNLMVNVTANDTNYANVTINLYNPTGLVNSTFSTQMTYFVNFTNLATGIYYFNATARDSFNNQNSTETRNVTVDYDVTPPVISITYPTSMTYNTNITELNYTVSDIHLQACWYSTDNGATNTTITCGTNISGLTSNEGSNTWKVYANDSYGNVNSASVTFTVDTTVYLPSGGGGGGATTGKTYGPTESQLLQGYSSALKVGEGINFDINNEGHKLTISSVGTNFVNLIITSSPISLKLFIGDSAKLNLTQGGYYDLYVKLESITAGKANITIKSIYEKIVPTQEGVAPEGPAEEEKVPILEGVSKKLTSTLILLVSFVILSILIILAILRIVRKKNSRRGLETKVEQDVEGYISGGLSALEDKNLGEARRYYKLAQACYDEYGSQLSGKERNKLYQKIISFYSKINNQ